MDIKDAVNDLRKRQVELALELAEHPAKTFEDYRERVGRYCGLSEAMERLLRLDKQDDGDG